MVINIKSPFSWSAGDDWVANITYINLHNVFLVLCIQYLSMSLFKRKSTSYSLRNSDFDIPTFNTINYGKHSLRYQGPHIWSKLDIKLKGSSNIESFKKNIRKKDLTSLLNNNNSCCNLCNSQRLPFIYLLFYYTVYTCCIF